MTVHQLDVLVVGGANVDHLVRRRALPLQPRPSSATSSRPSGRPRWTHRAALPGDRVETSAMIEDPDRSTGVALIMVDARGEKVIMTAPGANRKPAPATSPVSRAAAAGRRQRDARDDRPRLST